jgi:uncharacterized protein YjiS (DUF1127 family)
MTNAYAMTQDRSRASALQAGVDRGFAHVRTAWKQFLAYRRTLGELRDLTPRMLRDLGLDRGHLRAIAHREIYGR